MASPWSKPYANTDFKKKKKIPSPPLSWDPLDLSWHPEFPPSTAIENYVVACLLPIATLAAGVVLYLPYYLPPCKQVTPVCPQVCIGSCSASVPLCDALVASPQLQRQQHVQDAHLVDLNNHAVPHVAEN